MVWVYGTLFPLAQSIDHGVKAAVGFKKKKVSISLYGRSPGIFVFCCPRNLQAAIGAYYDFESPNISAPCMSFVKDVTIGEGESVPPDTPFTKTWRIQNTGKSVKIVDLI